MAVRAGNRIDHDVIMGMGLVQMGPDDDLKIIAEQTPCKLTPDLMGLLRRHLTGRKGLDEVVTEDAARLAEFLLGFRMTSKAVSADLQFRAVTKRTDLVFTRSAA
mgnify:CR=1 FL=1